MRSARYAIAAIYATVAGSCGFVPSGALAASAKTASEEVDLGGTRHVSAFDLPLSGLLDAETRAELKHEAVALESLKRVCPLNSFSETVIFSARQCYEKHYFVPLIKRQKLRYAVTTELETVAGVPVEIITPMEGVPVANSRRVLINLHGGGFIIGGRWGGLVESIPIAATGKFKVISVNYRMAPEYHFPAASQDAAAVYRELLKTYDAHGIGIYGCSAGGLLTAQVVAWLQKEGLPAPGAVGMFCAGGAYWEEGDSGYWSAAMSGAQLSRQATSQQNPYFVDTRPSDPLVFPIRSPQVMARFPPSLLITATRDLALSSVVQMHSILVSLGVEADLHVWEGLGHAFFFEPDLPQSREVYDVTVKFFDRYLDRH